MFERRRVACDPRVSFALCYGRVRAKGAWEFKCWGGMAGCRKLCARGSKARAGRQVPGGLGQSGRRGGRGRLGVIHILIMQWLRRGLIYFLV